jgi:hypothetical protein
VDVTKNTTEMLINRTKAITGENRERGKQGEGKLRRGENRERGKQGEAL